MADSFPSEDSTIVEWKTFLQGYSEGSFSPDTFPRRPSPGAARDPSLPFPPPPHPSLLDDFQEYPPYTLSPITDDVARQVRAYCYYKDHMPPPRSPHEALRGRLLAEYDILGPVQTGSIQAAVNILSAFFPQAVLTFTLFRNNVQTIFGVAGNQPLIDRLGIINNTDVTNFTSLCGHSVLLEDKIMFISRMDEDWRFRSNPYVHDGVVSYIGSPVQLKCDPLESTGQTTPLPASPGRPDSVAIGAINIMFVDSHHEVLTDAERMVITNTTEMLTAQLRLTWEAHFRTREAKARKVVTELIAEGLDGGQRQGEGSSGCGVRFAQLAQSALDKMIAASDLTGAALIDVRGICTMPGSRRFILDPVSSRPVTIVASSGPQVMSQSPSTDRVLAYLNDELAPFVYTRRPRSESGLEIYLPDDIEAHMLVPYFSHHQPNFILIGISHRVPIPDSTTNLVRSIGAILLSNSTQARVLEADASKTAFLSSISHELRTPLYGVLSGVELAQKCLHDGDTVGAAEVLDIAHSSSLALSMILNDVLDFSRPAQTGSMEQHVEQQSEVELIEVVKNAARMCMAQYKGMETAARIVLECEERRIRVNKPRYHRVLINGLTNAIKFCPTGTITLSISFTDRLVTRITDTGVGFDTSAIPRLLKPFTKADQHSPGAGLGLHITKQLVETMDGVFNLDSAVGKGTTFEAILPVAAAPPRGIVREVLQEERLRTAAEIPIAILLEKAADKLRVLIVDDNAICLKVLRAMLRKSETPVQCLQAASGEEAVEKFKNFEPHLVLTDVSMPGIDGIEAAQQMREIASKNGWRHCAIYALTGLGSSDPRLQRAAIGGDAALTGWRVKGLADMSVIQGIVKEAEEGRLERARAGRVRDEPPNADGEDLGDRPQSKRARS